MVSGFGKLLTFVDDYKIVSRAVEDRQAGHTVVGKVKAHGNFKDAAQKDLE